MGHRPDLGQMGDTDRHKLAGLIKEFLTQSVIIKHRKVKHMEQFFAHHRAYIFGLETFLKRKITDRAFLNKVVPLPFWNATMRLPSHFDTFDGGPAVAPSDKDSDPNIGPPPAPPTPPPPFSTIATVRAYLTAVERYDDELLEWKKNTKNEILLHVPVTDRLYLNTAYPGKPLPSRSGLDHPENFADAMDLCTARDTGRGLGMDITEGLITTALHYHGITHSSLAGIDTPVDEDDLINWALGQPTVNRIGKIGPFMNGANTAAPFIFWPLHAFFDTFYYTWEQAHLRPLHSPCVVDNTLTDPHQLELFQIGKDGIIWHCCGSLEDGPNTDNGKFGNWEHWHRIRDDQKVRRIAVINNDSGGIELFGITDNSNASLLHAQMLESSCEDWSGWDNLGGSNKEIAAVSAPEGVLAVFAIQIDTGIWFKRRPRNGSWSTWDQLFDVGQSQLAVIVDGNSPSSRIHVFSLANGSVWHRWETAARGAWSGPTESVVGGFTRQFTEFKVARNQNKKLQLFAIGTDKKVYTCGQNAEGANNDFSAWTLLHDGDTHDIAVGQNADRRLEIFLCGGGTVRHKWQQTANGSWANGEEIPLDPPMGNLKRPFTTRDPDGRLMVFGVAGDGLLWHAWQNAANQGPWLAWLVI